MSKRSLRRRAPFDRRLRQLHTSPSLSLSSFSRRKIPSAPHHQPLKPSSLSAKPVTILVRCKSEPALPTADVVVNGGGVDHWNLSPTAEFVLYRPKTYLDIYSSFQSLPGSPIPLEGYNKDDKVVVNVTVEGSPGPIRAMVKLGSSVEDTIKLVIKKYDEEGRTPRLDKNENAPSTFELHHSYFSLQGLNNTEVMGDIGSRSFYLRKCTSRCNSRGELVSASFTSADNARDFANNRSPLVFLPDFIAWKIKKIIRKTRKLWKLMGCIYCSE